MSKVSKVQKAVDTVRANQDKAPKDVITELEVVLGMARRGASTYYYNAKKVLKQEKRDEKNARRRELRAAKRAAREATGASDVDTAVQAEIDANDNLQPAA